MERIPRQGNGKERELANEQNPQLGWSARRLIYRPDEKSLMGKHFASHEFLVPDNSNPEIDSRERVSSILVNAGTTTYSVVKSCLGWIRENSQGRTFHVTWHTPGSLVPTALVDFRLQNPLLSAATHLYLFPGRVDLDMESVSGRVAEDFAEGLQLCFACSLLSGYSLDLETGTVHFYLPEEVRLQRACAMRFATRKFLFLDSSKFRREGDPGYTLDELLQTAENVTIYTVTSGKDEWLRVRFEELCSRILSAKGGSDQHIKSLRLCIVGKGAESTEIIPFSGSTLRGDSVKVDGVKVY